VPDLRQRAVTANEKGCSTAYDDRLYLYDEEAIERVDTGRDIRTLRGAMRDGRLLYDRKGDRELVLWDIPSDTTTALRVNTAFHAATRRDNTWLFATWKRHDTDESGLVVVHPGGVAHVDPAQPMEGFTVTDTRMAWIEGAPGQQTLRLMTFEPLLL
jgi:hypothetical protein